MTCKHCGIEIEPCLACPGLGVLGAGYVDAGSEYEIGAHWCSRIAYGTAHEPEATS